MRYLEAVSQHSQRTHLARAKAYSSETRTVFGVSGYLHDTPDFKQLRQAIPRPLLRHLVLRPLQ